MSINKLQLPNWPHIAEDEIAAVSAVLESGKINYWTGDVGKQFEAAFAQYVGVKHAVALANGTVGLELALKAINLQAGDEVIVPSKTFIATASAVVACQGVPVIADVELDSQNISADTIRPLISQKTRAIIVVHLAGLSCDMDPILSLAQEFNLKVIEDCAQAHGASYKNRLVGSIADIGVFSFCQDKIMTTGGEGGMLVTNNSELWRRAWEYKDHGKDYAAVHDVNPANTGFKWLHNSFGSNYRMTEMQSVIGLIQLQKLPEWLRVRQRNASILLTAIQQIPGLRVYNPPAEFGHAYYKFYFHVIDSSRRDKIMAELNSLGIPCREGSCSEIYREQAFVRLGLGPEQRLANAQQLSANSLMLPVHPTLGIEHMQTMAAAIQQVVERVTA